MAVSDEKNKNNKLILPQNQPVNKSSESEHPIFCLKNIQKEYCLSKCQRDEKAEFASTLHKLSQLTWNQIRHSDRHKSGCETIKRESIKRSVPEMVPQDANILAFRFSGMKPMVGYKDGQIFHVVWLDRGFTLYSH